ncbi:MAG: RNA 2',3'-cyclic phosphodiesterase [Thermodesulfobacterium geofontis]|uniref:RNA 2',3'-cyclic phosphodiesterase n=1 Tax=Thermodesulfobacterium geofontis TaxID=1295609 RepID=A0A2N7QGL5_9BACT|nr:MAG: RNA 2',3'-cyclic phosphodiesterase [Thermodesulfobacterium geofontis]PMP98133.1 MAG: RNA 2',3'-cyclic phosphodiesterase [Thermodesulfobacterium geofontis]
MVRAFLAIDLPQELKKELFSLGKTISYESLKLKWVEEENLHLTIRFFGNISENLVEKIYKKCKEVCKEIDPFELRLSSAGYFPFKGTPRVIWIGIEALSNNLFKLNDLLKKALKPLKLKENGEKFHPHITLLRVKEKTDPSALKSFFEELKKEAEKLEGKSFFVREIIIFKSELSPAGPKYTPLKIIPLKEK